jgi:hypothetical protein
MKRLFLLLGVVIVISLAGVQSTAAQEEPPPCSPPCVYVNPQRTPDGNESGQPGSPYSEFNEGKAAAQATPGGGWVYYRNPANGVWEKTYWPEAVPANLGTPLPSEALYLLIGILALILILVGRWLQRRSHQI